MIKVRWLLITLAAVLLAGCAQDQAKAEISMIEARRADQGKMIEQQYAAARANIQADALAELDLAKRKATQAIELQTALDKAAYDQAAQLSLLDAKHKQDLANIDAATARQLADVTAYTDTTRAAAARDVILSLAVGLGGAAFVILVGRGLGAGIAAWGRNRGEAVYPNAAGQLPAIVRSDLVMLPGRLRGGYAILRRPSAGERLLLAAGQALAVARGKPIDRGGDQWIELDPGDPQVTRADQHVAMIAAATRFGPNLSADRAARDILTRPDAPQALPAGSGQPGVTVPTFGEILRTWQPTRERMLFGYGADGQPLHGRLDQLLSGEIVGRQGSGKTTLLRMIYAQCALVGVKVLVFDLHEDVTGDLPGATAYTDAKSIDKSAAWLVAELDRRIAQRDRTAQPIMVLIDEINQLIAVVPAVAEAVGRVVCEGRKYNVFCVVSAKGMPAQLFGGSTVRDAFSTRFAFQSTSRQAAMIGFDREDCGAVRDLTPGRCLFDGLTGGAQVITIPLATREDVSRVLQGSGVEVKAVKWLDLSTSGNFRPEAEAEVTDPGSGPEVTPEVTPEAVRTMRAAGASDAVILRELFGVTGGRRYTAARAELAAIEAG